MNITEWLEDIAPASRPRPPKPIVQPLESLAVPGEAFNPVVHPSKKRPRSRKRSGADSFILEPDHTPPEVHHKSSHRKERKLARSDSSVFDSRDTQSTTSGSPTSGGGSIEVYRRRKRHKTRTDKYDSKHKRSRHNHADRDHRSRRTAKEKLRKREKKKVIKSRTAAAVVQNFDAPNVQCERLTLQQVPNVGLFKRGRASSPFRGRGIPDLVFSEMNFLQNRKDLHHAGLQFENARAGRSKDKARQVEEEISAYFTPGRPALQERDINHVPRQFLPHKNHTIGGDHQSVVSATSLTRHSVEPRRIPAKATRSRSASATYYTCSTSEAPGLHHASQVHSHTLEHGSKPRSRDPAAVSARDMPGDRRRAFDRRERQTTNQQSGASRKKSLRGPIGPTMNEIACEDRRADKVAHRDARPLLEARRNGPQKQAPKQSPPALPLPSSPPRAVRHGGTQAVIESSRSGSLPQLSPRTSPHVDAAIHSSHPLDQLLRGCNEAFAHRSSDLSNANHDDDGSSMLSKDSPEANAVEAHQSLRYENDDSRTQDDIRRVWRSLNQHDQQVPPVERMYTGYSGLPGLAHAESRNGVLVDDVPTALHVLDNGDNIYPAQASQVDEYTVENQDELFSSLPSGDGDGNVMAEVEEVEDEFDGFWQPNILY